MKHVNALADNRLAEQRLFSLAQHCGHFGLDVQFTPMLWHRSYCLHPEREERELTGSHHPCDLVWRGECPYGFGQTKETTP